MMRLLIIPSRLTYNFPSLRFFSISLNPDADNSNVISESEKKIRKKLYLLEYRLKNQEARREYLLKNKEKIKEAQREYRLKNKEKAKATRREYLLKNKEKVKEAQREYHLKNKEIIKEAQREYRLKNKEKVKEAQREYYLKNQEKLKEAKREYFLKNKEKVKEARREYLLKNEEKIRATEREHYLKNKEKIKEIKRKYRLKNIGKVNATQREYRLKNIGKVNAILRKYRLKNKEKLIERYIQKKKSIDKNYIHVRRKPLIWKDSSLLRNFFDDAGESLGITHLSSWYRVSISQIKQKGGSGLLSHYPSMGFALKHAYPEYPWDMDKFCLRPKKSGQRWLATLITKLLPHATVIEDYRGHPLLKQKETNRIFELDIWIEEYNLALEYQGYQHYHQLSPRSGFLNLEKRQEKDNQKMEMCKENGISLVQIPYWWDGTISSLSSTLHQYLPSLFAKTDSPPIPAELPLDYKDNKRQKIYILKEIMQGYDHQNENPEGWFMSEKLDGIRAYWDGEQFWSKNARKINVPESFKTGLPTYPLDGELWSGYGLDDLTVFHLKVTCRNKIVDLDWTKIKFYVFDTPKVKATYDLRHLFLQNNIPQYGNPNIMLIPMQKCRGNDHLRDHLEEIIAKGGEGIMIYNPDSLYEPGRTKNILKVKKYFECYVTFLNLSGSSYNFLCEQENGTQCLIKCSPEYYRNPPNNGDRLLIRHLGLFPHSPKYKYPALVEVEPVKPHKIIENVSNNIE